jgi:hypothetical protein
VESAKLHPVGFQPSPSLVFVDLLTHSTLLTLCCDNSTVDCICKYLQDAAARQTQKRRQQQYESNLACSSQALNKINRPNHSRSRHEFVRACLRKESTEAVIGATLPLRPTQHLASWIDSVLQYRTIQQANGERDAWCKA